MKSKCIAYLWWFLGLFGVLGFHRFYLGKFGTGIIWLLTGSVAGIGAIIDLFTLGGQVDNWNNKKKLKKIEKDQKHQMKFNEAMVNSKDN